MPASQPGTASSSGLAGKPQRIAHGSTARPRAFRPGGRLLTASLTLVISGLLCLLDARGQSVFVPSPEEPHSLDQPPSTAAGTNDMPASGESAAAAIPGGPGVKEPFRLGSFVFHPRIDYSITYGNGIQSSPSNHQDTFLHEIDAGLTINIGRIWHLDYSPTALFYSDTNFQDTLNHYITVAGETKYDDWRLGLSQSCGLSMNPSVETGTQTGLQSYVTRLSATYQFNGSLSLEAGLQQDIQLADGSDLQNTFDWSTLEWLQYEVAPSLSFSLGAGAGYTMLDANSKTNTLIGPNSDMIYEQIRGRATFWMSQKISLYLDGGAEFRQFVDPSAPPLVSPIYGLRLAYQPLRHTMLSLDAHQSVSPAYLQNQLTETTSLTASARQRLLGHLNLNLSGGYSFTSYRTTQNADVRSRQDNYSFVRVDLEAAFLKHCSCSVFYSYSRNESDEDGFTYNSDQVGLKVGISY